MKEKTVEREEKIGLAVELSTAFVRNNPCKIDELPTLLATAYSAIDILGKVPEHELGDEKTAPAQYEPAVSVRKSLASREHIISMIDGKPYKTLRRHLGTHGLTPETYRERYGLKPDYPMVAEAYSEQRRDMAKKIGLGTKPNKLGNKDQASA